MNVVLKTIYTIAYPEKNVKHSFYFCVYSPFFLYYTDKRNAGKSGKDKENAAYAAEMRGNMISLEITGMKNFMNRLLATDAFDGFLLAEAVIGTANTITIDGRINHDFYAVDSDSETDAESHSGGISRAQRGEFRPWGEIRKLCFDLIKGRRPPLFLRFVLHLMPGKASALLEKEGCEIDPSLVKALVLNIRYDGSKTVLTTGISYQTFVPTREPDAVWDKALIQFLDAAALEYELL